MFKCLLVTLSNLKVSNLISNYNPATDKTCQSI